MKRQILPIAILLMSFISSAYAEKRQVPLNNNTNTNNMDDHHKRTPVLIPTAFIDGHTLTFDSSCIGCPITVLEDDVIVFWGTIDEEGTLVLPDSLDGSFTIEVQRGSITFVGEIELV